MIIQYCLYDLINIYLFIYLFRLSDNDYLLLKLVIAGAFYPNYFYWSEIDEELAQREMSGHDPTTTVMVTLATPN